MKKKTFPVSVVFNKSIITLTNRITIRIIRKWDGRVLVLMILKYSYHFNLLESKTTDVIYERIIIDIPIPPFFRS